MEGHSAGPANRSFSAACSTHGQAHAALMGLSPLCGFPRSHSRARRGAGRETIGKLGMHLPRLADTSSRVPPHQALPRAPTAAEALPVGGRLRDRHSAAPTLPQPRWPCEKAHMPPHPVFFIFPGLAFSITYNLIIRLRASLES